MKTDPWKEACKRQLQLLKIKGDEICELNEIIRNKNEEIELFKEQILYLQELRDEMEHER
jgi:hypothetical protein